MIIGLGNDIIEISRVEKAIQKQHFLNRLFTVQEQEYCNGRPNRGESYAAIFAAKESAAKAFGCGFGAKLGWLDLEIVHTEGKPSLIFRDKGAELAEEMGVKKAWVSLSHGKEEAFAVVILEG